MINHFRAGAGPGRERPSRSRTPLEVLTPPSFVTPSEAQAPRARTPAVVAPPFVAPPLDVVANARRLLDGLCQAIRTLHYSRRTERAYVYWVSRFVTHYSPRDPVGMGADEIRSFLSHLAVNQRVSASTQNQALCALVFLYGRVLGLDLGSLAGIEWAKAPRRSPSHQ